MRKTSRRKTLWFPFAAVFLFSSCVTINIYFPAAAVEKAADRIIEETWGSDTRNGETKQEEKGPGSLLLPDGPAFTLGPAPAAAQNVDINVSTAAIRALKESMRKRSGTLKPYLESGAVGLANNGHLVVRDPNALGMKDRAAVTRGVEAENNDREALYSEIAAANKFEADRVNDIRAIFAESWARNAQVGWWLQNSKGEWKKKPPE